MSDVPRDDARPSLFDGVPPSDDLTLEDHAFMAGITGEMLERAVQAGLQRAFRAQVEQYIAPPCNDHPPRAMIARSCRYRK